MEYKLEQKKHSLDYRIDYGVILPVFVLIIIGFLALYSALGASNLSSGEIIKQLIKQSSYYFLGIVAVIVIMQFTTKQLWKLTPTLYAIGLLLLTLPLKFYDTRVAALTGSKNWVDFGGSIPAFQPSELAKISYILMLAYVITRHNVSHTERNLRSDLELIGKMLLCTVPIGILLYFENDFGTLLVFLAIFGGGFLMSGISWKIILPGLIFVVVVGGGVIALIVSDSGREFLLKHGIVQAYQINRIDIWLDPFQDATNKGYQLAQALTAIGSGGIFGKGFNVSEVYVPVQESDMIFTVIGENFGFIGSCLVILMYFMLIYRMVRVCFETDNEFYTHIATGIIMMILFHVFENIGANIGLLPLTGIPLPFISQGGSAVLSNMIGIGLILSMRFQRTSYNPRRH